MRQALLLKVSALFLTLSLSPISAFADQYELYSWKTGNDWEFSVVPGVNNASKAAVEIKSGQVRGAGQVKSKILAMKEGDSIVWQIRPTSDMTYPPDSTVADLQDYALSLGIKLIKATT